MLNFFPSRNSFFLSVFLVPHVNCYISLFTSRLTYGLISCLANHLFAFSIQGKKFFRGKEFYFGIKNHFQGNNIILQKILNHFFVDDVVENSNTGKKPEKSQFYVFGSCAPFQDHAVFCVGGCKSALSLCRKSSEIIGSCRARAFLLQKAFFVQEIYRFRSRKPGEFVQVNGS